MRTHSKVKGYCTERSMHLGTAWGLINSRIKETECVCASLCVSLYGWEVFLQYLYQSKLMQVAISHMTATNNQREKSIIQNK